MLGIVYLGGGGRYTQYLKESVKRTQRMRPIQLLDALPSGQIPKYYRVGIHTTGRPLNRGELLEILDRENITFVIGDSRGLKPEILSTCDVVYSISHLPISHQFEAAILAEQIENTVINGS